MCGYTDRSRKTGGVRKSNLGATKGQSSEILDVGEQLLE